MSELSMLQCVNATMKIIAALKHRIIIALKIFTHSNHCSIATLTHCSIKYSLIHPDSYRIRGDLIF